MVTEFPHFGSVQSEPTDHYYLSSNDSDAAKKRLHKRDTSSAIMKEWKILENNLPDSIFVRVYETRIDLLRAVIVGPAGTPYHDSLFFFDILLPFDYPKQPPQVYYHSHGYRINPNLYENGRLCLSLINTWQGATSEMWTKKSTLLQILVSIQGLVLNERPFFNEPSYADAKNSKDSIWTSRSIRYNESTFVLSCKTMLHVIRKPPENFEGFVARHFRERAPSILAAIKYYHEGRVLVGQFDHQMDNSIGEAPSSFELSSPLIKADLMRLHSDFKKEFPDVISEPINMNTSTENNVKKTLPISSSSSNITDASKGSTENVTDSEGSTDEKVKKESPGISSSTYSKINGKKPNKKGFLGKLISNFGKCTVMMG